MVIMRTLAIALLLSGLTQDAAAQPRPRVHPSQGAMFAESAVKRATEMMAASKKIMERDLAVLLHLRNADTALRDPMQPVNAITKALEEVEAAKSLDPEFLVMQGVLRTLDELERARRSPGSADFPRLRSILRDDALEPASRLAARNALALQEEMLAWLKVQELITAHLAALSEIAGNSLRATQNEK